jgi:hypothetical protein
MEIKIGGYTVSVVHSDNLVANGLVGEYAPFEQKISIANGLSKQHEQETLIHEVLEAINDLYELGLEHDSQLCKLSVVLHQIIVDNEDLLNALRTCV